MQAAGTVVGLPLTHTQDWQCPETAAMGHENAEPICENILGESLAPRVKDYLLCI